MLWLNNLCLAAHKETALKASITGDIFNLRCHYKTIKFPKSERYKKLMENISAISVSAQNLKTTGQKLM